MVTNETSEDRLVISLHIPKTGGTSFLDALKRAYPEPGQLAFYYRPGNKLTDPRLRDRAALRDPQVLAAFEADGVRVLHGHAPGRWFLKSVPDQSRYWTWVRNPVERVISAYYYQRGRHERGRPNTEKVAGVSLEDFARAPENQNGQSRMLRGLNLKRMGFVGITERYDESLELLGFQAPRKPRNRNSAKPTVEAETKALIASLNADDMVLYEKAVKVFEKRLAKR